MTSAELKRVEMMAEVRSGKISMTEASRQLGISKRQARRLQARYKESGGAGLIHQSRGRPSGRALPDWKGQEICRLLRSDYLSFGPTLAAEYLAERNGIKVSREKIRQIQIKEGLWKPKQRKEGRCHPRRERSSRS